MKPAPVKPNLNDIFPPAMWTLVPVRPGFPAVFCSRQEFLRGLYMDIQRRISLLFCWSVRLK
jgi:hypothetical protein